MINAHNIQHVLITRTDNIGDVILTLPLCGILKSQFPQMKIYFLARDYVKDVVKHCTYVDEFVSWDMLSTLSKKDAIAFLQQKNIDLVLHTFQTKTITSLMKAAGIRYRIGTTRRIYSWWTCNVHVNLSRKHSNQHEAQLNVQLLKALGLKTDYSLIELNQLMGLHCDQLLPAHLDGYIKKDRFNLIVHPLTNKHTLEWPLSYFSALIRELPADRFNILVTGSEKEKQIIQDHIMSSDAQHAVNVAGQCSLQELMQLIVSCDGLVANATGPLHLAASLGIHALGLFPGIKGIDPTRWGPVGKKAEYLMSAAPQTESSKHMESITVTQVRDAVMKWIL